MRAGKGRPVGRAQLTFSSPSCAAIPRASAVVGGSLILSMYLLLNTSGHCFHASMLLGDKCFGSAMGLSSGSGSDEDEEDVEDSGWCGEDAEEKEEKSGRLTKALGAAAYRRVPLAVWDRARSSRTSTVFGRRDIIWILEEYELFLCQAPARARRYFR